MKRMLFLIFCMLCVPMTGCTWVGQTTGKAQAKIERKTQDLEQGYNKGYEDEKAKSAPNSTETPQTPT
jgi:hypothetical protein